LIAERLRLNAVAPDVRKGFAFPASYNLEVKLCLTNETQPRGKVGPEGKPWAFRTSGGKAAQKTFGVEKFPLAES
jgi:hypothetical protein